MYGIHVARGPQAARLLRNQHATGAATAGNGQGPMLYNEVWAAAIDATNVWNTAVGGTGGVSRQRSNGRGAGELNCPAAGDTARLYGRKGLYNPSAITIANRVYRQLVMEWEADLTNLANVDNAVFFQGFFNEADTPSLVGRTRDDVVGFVLSGDALQTLTDNGGTETLTAVAAAPTLTNVNKFKIVVRNGAVDFSVNGVLKNTHTSNVPTGHTWLPLFAHAAEAATGATKAEIGPLRCYVEE